MSNPVLGAKELECLRDRFQEYSRGSHYRANARTIRSRAHAVIRELTAPDNLPKLSLDDFDQHIWRLGSMSTRHESFDWHHAEEVLADTHPDRFTAMLDSGEIGFVGNMTWGSAVGTLRAYAHGRSRDEVEAQMRQGLRLLLHRPDPIERRLRQAKDLRIGFGRNICSGLLMVWYPREFILYNSCSEQFWASFGLSFEAGYNWVSPYLRYNAFCQGLLTDPVFNLQNLVELDVFIYWHTVQFPTPRKKTTPTKQKRGRKPKVTKAGITLAQLRATKQEMSPDQFRATWGEQYDQLVVEELAKTTTDVTPAELGRRARRRLDEIHAFLHGQTATSPSSEVLCDWIQFCYALELYREASALLRYVREDEVDTNTYRRTTRMAEVSRGKLTN
ncbi:MAG: hypothetical protein ISS49_17025 [Anaerolineae bacterium]|nr:hypothetical protein [Anaerolineae bacterium]